MLIFAHSFLYLLTVALQSLQTSLQARADSKSMLSRMISRASGHFLKRFFQSSWFEAFSRHGLSTSASISEDRSAGINLGNFLMVTGQVRYSGTLPNAFFWTFRKKLKQIIQKLNISPTRINFFFSKSS